MLVPVSSIVSVYLLDCLSISLFVCLSVHVYACLPVRESHWSSLSLIVRPPFCRSLAILLRIPSYHTQFLFIISPFQIITLDINDIKHRNAIVQFRIRE